MVITFHGCKVVEKHIFNRRKITKESISDSKKEFYELLTYEEITNSSPVPPFPQALIKPKKSNQNREIYKAFKLVKVNIALLDVIKHEPSYAKFLKDLCIVKRKHNVMS